MTNLARLDVELYRLPPSRRASPRQGASASASLRAWKGSTEAIRLTDISPTGCGFEARWPFQAGARVWLRLPGIEPWAATIIWFEDGRGGLSFERPLHPAVATRFIG